MKKSDHFAKAQLAVLRDNNIQNTEKLAIIHTLQESEDTAKYTERIAAEKEAAE